MPTRRPIETAFSTRDASVAGGRSPTSASSGGGANGYRTPAFAPRCAARYSSRYLFTVSNASAGMIFPRIRG